MCVGGVQADLCLGGPSILLVVVIFHISLVDKIPIAFTQAG